MLNEHLLAVLGLGVAIVAILPSAILPTCPGVPIRPTLGGLKGRGAARFIFNDSVRMSIDVCGVSGLSTCIHDVVDAHFIRHCNERASRWTFGNPIWLAIVGG